jgi:pimeloyl-ACP methyl ester carboxylesterase
MQHDRDVARWLRRGMAANFYDLEAMERFQARLIRSPMPSVDALHGLPDRREPWVAQGLSRIDAPTLVIGARYDVATPLAEAREVAERIPGAQLVIIDRAGHNPWAERPDEVARAISEFVDRLPDDAGRRANHEA